MLARSLADSFIECWKCKYTHWTERPDMAIPDLPKAMDDPPFPAYVSGHSTISATAATILGFYVPDKKPLWLNDAQTARDSRLYAGIHFPMDNERGFQLGIDVANTILATHPA